MLKETIPYLLFIAMSSPSYTAATDLVTVIVEDEKKVYLINGTGGAFKSSRNPAGLSARQDFEDKHESYYR